MTRISAQGFETDTSITTLLYLTSNIDFAAYFLLLLFFVFCFHNVAVCHMHFISMAPCQYLHDYRYFLPFFKLQAITAMTVDSFDAVSG